MIDASLLTRSAPLSTGKYRSSGPGWFLGARTVPVGSGGSCSGGSLPPLPTGTVCSASPRAASRSGQCVGSGKLGATAGTGRHRRKTPSDLKGIPRRSVSGREAGGAAGTEPGSSPAARDLSRSDYGSEGPRRLPPVLAHRTRTGRWPPALLFRDHRARANEDHSAASELAGYRPHRVRQHRPAEARALLVLTGQTEEGDTQQRSGHGRTAATDQGSCVDWLGARQSTVFGGAFESRTPPPTPQDFIRSEMKHDLWVKVDSFR